MIIHVIDNLDPGGAQSILFELASRIEGSSVFSLRGPARPGWLGWDAVYHPAMRRTGRWRVVAALLRLARLCVRERKRALFVAHLDASTLALCLLKPLLGFRLFVMVHAAPWQWPGWYRWCFRRVIGLADRVIGGGQRHRSALIEENVAPDKIVLAGIGARLFDEGARPAERDVRAEFGIRAGQPILLNVGRLVPGKNQADILRALHRLERPEVVAVIVGDGPESANLATMVRELKLDGRVFLAGRRTDLHNFYPASAMLLMPCLDESMGVVILDGLAYRLPIVAYNSGCIDEFLRDGENGLLIAPDAELLAASIARVLDSPPALDYARNAHYSMEAMVERFRRLCQA